VDDLLLRAEGRHAERLFRRRTEEVSMRVIEAIQDRGGRIDGLLDACARPGPAQGDRDEMRLGRKTHPPLELGLGDHLELEWAIRRLHGEASRGDERALLREGPAEKQLLLLGHDGSSPHAVEGDRGLLSESLVRR
jgi:hypothetical protein